MQVIALLLRPSQLDDNLSYRRDIRSLQQTAETRMWIILVASFLVILVLVALAIVLGRKAMRLAGNDTAVARLRKWGGICLTCSLVSLGIIVLAERITSAILPAIGFSYIYTIIQLIVAVFIVTAVMGAMCSLILKGITVRKTSVRPWLGLVISGLLALLWFLSVAFLARFFISYEVHLVL